MSKKRFVLASVVMVALSASVYAAPVNIVDNNGKSQGRSNFHRRKQAANITLGENAVRRTAR